MLIVVVGTTCAGKSEFARIAAESGFHCVEWGQTLDKMIDAQGANNRTESLFRVVEYIRRNSRSEVMADFLSRLRAEVRENSDVCRGLVLIGARHAADLAYILGAFPRHAVVLVHADVETRFRRCIARGRHGDPGDLLAFIKADMQEQAQGLAEVVADFVGHAICNSTDMASFESSVRQYMHCVLKPKE